MNSIPADSRAVFNAAIFAGVLLGIEAPPSILFMVLVLIPEIFASSETVIFIAYLALRICAAVIIDIKVK